MPDLELGQRNATIHEAERLERSFLCGKPAREPLGRARWRRPRVRDLVGRVHAGKKPVTELVERFVDTADADDVSPDANHGKDRRGAHGAACSSTHIQCHRASGDTDPIYLALRRMT